jgi:hypothetical protein
MYLKSFICVCAIVLCLPNASFAHSGGHMSINEVYVIPVATENVAILIKEGIELRNGLGKLDESWNKIPESQKKIAQKGEAYYVVSFTNPKDKKSLYLLMSLGGDLMDANFSGKFEGLEDNP